MTMEDKKGLLERYKTEGGLKNLQWVNEYFETVTDTTEQKDVAESGWMTPGQIFTLNGFSWEQTEEKKPCFSFQTGSPFNRGFSQ